MKYIHSSHICMRCDAGTFVDNSAFVG